MRITALLILLLFCIKGLAATLDVRVQNMQTQVTLRLETGPVNFEYTYFEDLEITEDGDYSFSKDMADGEYFKISIKDQPENEACSAIQMTGVYAEGQDIISISCPNRSVTLTALASFSGVADNQIRTVVSAKSRDTGQAVSGLLEEDFDIVQDEGESSELRFSEQPEYFRHVIPLSAMALEHHLILSYDLSNSVSSEEITSIKFRSRKFITELAGDGNDNLPDNIRITINSFNENFTTHIAESQNVAELHAAVNSLTRSNGGANLYGSTIQSLDLLTTTYLPTNTETGAVIIITDGTDTSGISSSSDVIAARGNKPLFFVGIGNDINEAELQIMASASFPERVVTAIDYTSLNAVLLSVAEEFVKLIDSSYLVMLASPLRDSAIHTVRIDLAGQVSCAEDLLSESSDPPCFDNYSGSYAFTSSTSAAAPEVILLGDGRLEEGELSPLLIKTLWSGDTPDYGFETTHQFSEVTVTGNEQNSELVIQMNSAKVASTLTITDNNWGITVDKSLSGPQFISVNRLGSGSEDDIGELSLTRSIPLIDVEITNINGEFTPQWQLILGESESLSLVELIGGDTPQYRIQFSPGVDAVNLETSLTIEDSANAVILQLPVSATASQLVDGEFDDVLAFSTWLLRFGLDIGVDSEGDADGDGLSNLLEFQSGSNPLLADSDFDGISDLAEVNKGTSPTQAFYQVAIGNNHSCLLDDSGVRCQLHSGVTFDPGVASVPTLSNPVQVTSGQNFSCALDDDGLSCWGINNDSVNSAPEVENISEISSGFRHSCLVSESNIRCWGEGENDLLTVPEALNNPSKLTVGKEHACVIDDAGLQCWGDNSNGQLNIPDGLEKVTEVMAGQFHTCAIAANTVHCWGAELADFGVLDIPEIVNPRNLQSADNSVCVNSDNGIVCWGQGFKFVDMTAFFSQVYQPVNYDVKPDGTGLCVLDLEGLKCSDSFNDNLINLGSTFTVRRQQFSTPTRDQNNTVEILFRDPLAFEQIEFEQGGDIINTTLFGKDINDIPLLGDFDGDGLSDFAVRRPQSGYWYILNSGIATFNSPEGDSIQRVLFGKRVTDIPTPGDYDGDSITDIAFWRPENGIWYVKNSSGTNLGSERQDGIQRHVFGKQPTDIPIPGDYDGDGITDMSFWRASNQTWYVKNSSGSNLGSEKEDGIQRINLSTQPGAIPLSDDFDLDGIDDMAFYQPEDTKWTIRFSALDSVDTTFYGTGENAVPVSADYDGDGIADLAVYDQQNDSMRILYSGSEIDSGLSTGLEQAIPLAAPISVKMTMAASVQSE